MGMGTLKNYAHGFSVPDVPALWDMPWKFWHEKQKSAVLPGLPGKPVTAEAWRPEDLEGGQFVHSMSILYACIQVHQIYYACADHLIYCHGLLPGAARPACLEHVGFTAHTRDICEHAQSPFLLRLARRKYRNRTQTSGFTLVLHFSARRQRLLGEGKCSSFNIILNRIVRKLVCTFNPQEGTVSTLRAN